MGYFDGLTKASFKELESGNAIFYPYGKFGSGYLIEENQKVTIEKFIKKYYIISLPITIISVVIFQFYALLLMLVEIPVYIVFIKQLFMNTKKTSEKMTYKERIYVMAKSMGLATNIILLLCSILMTSLSILCVTFPEGRVIGIIGILFFGFALIQFILMVKCVLGKSN